MQAGDKTMRILLLLVVLTLVLVFQPVYLAASDNTTDNITEHDPTNLPGRSISDCPSGCWENGRWCRDVAEFMIED